VLLEEAIGDLYHRAAVHDMSKLEEPELAVFDEFTPKLNQSEYGSDEYKKNLVAMGKGLRHHYDVNRHHPEHWSNGVYDMNLIDLIEMLADWKAAALRNENTLDNSITQNAERFRYDERFEDLLRNTARYLGWL
jgi:hypothetical protein